MAKKTDITDALSPRVDFTVDGQTYRLLLDHNALIEAEDVLGDQNVLTGRNSIFRPSAKLLRALLYVALKRAGAKYSLEETGRLINPANLLEVQKAVQGAYLASMPEPEPEPEPGRPQATAEAGQ